MNHIIFLGCSFTWGEGLELFIEEEKWIKQRELYTEYQHLYPLEDEKSKQYREKNRYVGIVERELGIKPIVDDKNGGCFSTKYEVMKNMGDTSNVKHIFVQLSQISRNAPHLYWNCRCSYCLSTNFKPMAELYVPILENRITRDIQYVMDLYGAKKLDNDFLGKFLVFQGWVGDYVTNLFIEHCKIWEKTIAPVHFIDSWSDEDSKYWEKFSYIQDRRIDLIGKNGSVSKKFKVFSDSLDQPYLSDIFPKTQNGHPSLEMHQHLAKSVISHLRENFGY